MSDSSPILSLSHPYSGEGNASPDEIRLLSFWFNAGTPALLVSGIGDTGKTRLAWEWLRKTFLSGGAKESGLEGIITWNFQVDSDFEAFIRTALKNFPKEEASVLKGQMAAQAGLISAATQSRWLFVLDGFERCLKAFPDNKSQPVPGDYLTSKSSQCSQFLKSIGPEMKSKFLILSRLQPGELENSDCVQQMALNKDETTDPSEWFR